MGARYQDNNDGTFTLIRDSDGFKSTFMDPDGSYRAELDKLSTASGEIAGSRGDAGKTPVAGQTAPPVARGYVPETNAAYRPPPMQPMVSDAGFEPMPAEAPQFAGNPAVDPAAAPAPAAPATMRLTIPGSPGESSTTTTTPQTTNSRSESITNKDPDGVIAAAQGEALTAEATAGEALVTGKRKALENSGSLIAQEMLRARAENAAQTEIANEREVALASALADRKAKRAVPIDPGKAFADDGGAAAMAATIGFAIANVGLAWMGQSAQPIRVIDDLVERSVAIQREQKQMGIDEASETVVLNRAQLAEAKANARVSLAQMLDAQRADVENDNELAMLDSLAADNEAKLKQHEVEYATAIADDVTIQKSQQTTTGGTSTTTKSGTPDTVIELPAGSDEETAADAVNAARFDQGASEGDKKQLSKLSENVQYTNERARVIQELENLEKEGHVSDVVGLWQAGGGKLAELTGVQKYALSPEQNRARDLLAKLEGLNRFSWKTEPNSVKTQERMANLGLPANDSDIPTFFAKQKESVNEMRNADYLGYDDKVVGKFRNSHRKVKPSEDIEAF